MAQTTTKINAKDCTIAVDDGTTLRDISGSSNLVNLNPERMVGETYTFDGDWRNVLPGKRKWGGSIRAVYSETDAEAMDVLYQEWVNDGSTSICVRPAGAGVGNWEWSGEVYFTTCPIPLDAADANPILVEFAFEGDGELKKGTSTT